MSIPLSRGDPLVKDVVVFFHRVTQIVSFLSELLSTIDGSLAKLRDSE